MLQAPDGWQQLQGEGDSPQPQQDSGAATSLLSHWSPQGPRQGNVMLCTSQNHNRFLPAQSFSPSHLLNNGKQQQQVLPTQTFDSQADAAVIQPPAFSCTMQGPATLLTSPFPSL